MLALNLPLDYRTKAWHIPGFKFEKGIFGIDQTIMFKPRHMTKSRSISTVGGSGATCTRNFFELFFQNR